MNIKKMLLLASMALAAIAFAAPAAAQAEVVLTDPEGVPLEKGAEFTATSTDLTTTTENGNLECAHVELHFEVAANGPEHVVVTQTTTATTEGCSLSGVLPATITDGTIGVGEGHQLTLDTWGTGETNATFIDDLFLDAEHKELFASCHAEGTVHVQGAASGSDILNVGPSVLGITNPNCPEAGIIHGEFTMDTGSEEPVTLDFVETE